MAGLLSTGLTGLMAFQRALDVTSHNIANVNTEGYSRQVVNFDANDPQFLGGNYIGTGVGIAGVDRVFDDFLNAQLRSSTSAYAAQSIYFDFATQIDNLLADPDAGLSPALTSFFQAVSGVANDPASIPARQVWLTEAEALVDRFHQLSGQLDTLRAQVNTNVVNVVGEINGLADSIARLNQDILRAEGSGSGAVANDLRDERDRVIQELAERVAVTTVVQDDGAVNVFIGNGQALVVGTTTQTLVAQASPWDPTEMQVAVANGATTTDITSSLTGGSLGGMLDFRRDVLDPAQNALGRVVLGLTEDLNAQHALGLDLNGNFGSDILAAATPEVFAHSANSGGTVSASVVDANGLSTSDYLLQYQGSDTYTLLRLSDNQVTTINTGGAASFTTTTIDGMTLTIDAGAVAGDSFLVRPTRGAASSIDLLLTDPATIAAAAPLRAGAITDGNGLPLNTGSGAITQPTATSTTGLPLSGSITLTFDANAGGAGIPGFLVSGGPAGPLLYDPATEGVGKTFTLTGYGDMQFTLSGTPAAGDRFVIETNTGGTGDNRNALALGALESVKGLIGGTATYSGAYGQLVASVGTQTLRAEINQEAQLGLLNQAMLERESVSGVNLDEEAANLVRYQMAYEAAAQVVATTNRIFETLLAAFGR